MNKDYYLYPDLIEVAGSEAIKKLGENGNTVWVNLDEIEQKADDPKNRDSDQFIEALSFIENGEFNIDDEEVKLPTGGTLKWGDDYEKDVTRITRKPGLHSSLKRKGFNVDRPEFLKYGHEVLDDFILDVTWNYPMEELTPQRLEEELEREIINNQILRVNQSMIRSFRYPAVPVNKKHERYVLDEDNPYLSEFPEHVGTNIEGFEPRNLEQKIGTWQLMDTNTEVHFVVGGSGSGKSVLTYATAVSQILGNEKTRKKTGREGNHEKETYEGILLFKSNDLIGGKDRDEGFRPGNDFEKAMPFMKSFMDAHTLCGLGKDITFEEMLYHPEKELGEWPKRTKQNIGDFYLPSRNPAIEVEHLRFARGRTFENKLVFVDEAQNYTPYEMKQLIERVGVGSKIYIVGDPKSQIDNPKLDENFNGLTFALDMLYGSHPRTTLTVLDETYRSQAAEISRGKKAPRI